MTASSCLGSAGDPPPHFASPAVARRPRHIQLAVRNDEELRCGRVGPVALAAVGLKHSKPAVLLHVVCMPAGSSCRHAQAHPTSLSSDPPVPPPPTPSSQLLQGVTIA